MKILFLFFLLIILSPLPAQAEAPACEDGSGCIPPNSWQVGLALGLGGRTNPLVDGDAIPYILLPDIAWYGEAAYFDNGELGYQFIPTDTFSIELFVAPNAEKANFSFWHTSNILIPAASLAADAPPDSPQEPSTTISVDDIASRNWAVDGGIRGQWYAGNQQLQLAIARDISGVYSGFHAALTYRYYTQWKKWQIAMSPHVSWKSAALTDYYYGIREQDTATGELTYTGRAGLQYGVSINGSYPLTSKWTLLTRAGFTRLHAGMTDSPIVNKDTIYSVFTGVAYRF
ncbi:MipA/OmpV family protein [Alteromonas sp. ASW11-19]|uniref:MipA/OmpV family protein n=1 Tax=Alteromonas salexigens TaxID=2982530 RepID=A0ABT2VPV3_9ALTE|nr:MipA/OmpV family protein [Alteromonas salexigens]MCU7555352.1 MipA/OmpV family protein [Alteromonas salexigens]